MAHKGKPHILVIDDGLDYARVVADQLPEFKLITPEGQPCLKDGPAAMAWLGRHHDDVDVVLLDMHFDVAEDRLLPLPGESSLRRQKRFQGVAILREIRRKHPNLPVVLLTAVEDLSLVDVDGELANQSMTYVLDGEDLDTLRIRINAAVQESSQGLEEEDLLWGSNRAMQAIRRRLGGFEGLVRRFKQGRRIGHRGIEPQLVEPVPEVVVRVDVVP